MGIADKIRQWGLARKTKTAETAGVLEDIRPPLPQPEESKDLKPAEAKELNPVYGVAWDDSLITTDMHPGAPIGYATLRQFSKIPAVAGIIRTRTNQVAEFAHPIRREGDTGYIVEPIDPTQEITPEIARQCHEIAAWIWTCGDPRCGHGDNLEAFLRKLTPDTLALDQGCFEVRETEIGDIAGFQAVDSATMRFALPDQEERAHLQYRESMEEEGQVVQVIDNKIVATWPRNRLAMGIRNPSTNIRSKGYGEPELYILVAALSWMVDAEVYNAAAFKNGTHAKGILALKSNMPRKMFQQLRRDYFAMLKGPKNAHKTLFLQLNPAKDVSEELQYLNMSRSNQEMEFAQWLGYLQKLAASVFQIDMAELGFVYGSENQSGGLQQSSGESRVQYSREKGLRPLLRAIESWLNKWVVTAKFPGYRMRFVGLDYESDRKRIEDLLKQSKVMSTNEIRSRMGLQPITKEMEETGAISDLPNDAQYIHAVVARRQQLFTESMAEDGYDVGGNPHPPEPSDRNSAPAGGNNDNQSEEKNPADEMIYYGPSGGQYLDPEHKISAGRRRRAESKRDS